ncbi:MAG: hypothetical protein PHY14_01920 [Candidatus Gracilibacteria bacterium]|nr:hypothetical protein [Candidatus Gracilibacteria bacterium]
MALVSSPGALGKMGYVEPEGLSSAERAQALTRFITLGLPVGPAEKLIVGNLSGPDLVNAIQVQNQIDKTGEGVGVILSQKKPE